MAEKVIMPKLGATMEEGTIDEWLVEIGEEVEEGDPIVAIQTDKITIEVEAETTGILLKKLYDSGEKVPVQKVIAYIGAVNESIAEDESAEQQQDKPVNPQVSAATNSVQPEKSDDHLIRRTPIARRLAEENNISLTEVSGTGPQGRIQKADVEKHMEQTSQKITSLAKKISETEGIDVSSVTGSGIHGKIVKDDVIFAPKRTRDSLVATSEKVAFKGMRKVIADRISESFYSAPHVTLFSEIDMTEAVTLRKNLLPVIEEIEGIRISFNDIVVKAVTFSLKKNSNMNISLENEKDIILHSNINIGFAVAVSDGLVVPVLRNADQKGLGYLAKESKKLAGQARDGSLLLEDMQGSTFTISNLGMYAVDGFTPIINQPNAAILGVGRITEKPVAVNGKVEVRSMMTLSLSFDHRIIDGAPAAQFLTDLKGALEQPYQLLV